MKKFASLLLVAGMFSFFACGPSQEEKDAIEKARQDSIRIADSLKQVAYNDSIAKLAADTTKVDSTAAPTK